ncbi:uncharacterized protein EV420DRAFT_1707462 [Desarmillaria tabescens]|uniref:DNA2/NAM7 helicase helicase domain-containing protein n=1 Tax=Armillaria tabescens TaxID=1929756 RepID=A0AA39IXP3_ARMTA|nr:uncharacterized protein EV420DRAFT_1707462 [Desarmillaria tabescens]KAK0431636.1 hypothetical protein EV420DRAFT_1707462 [Desarmillaria tabescens]
MDTQCPSFALHQDIYTAPHCPIIVSCHNANALRAVTLHYFMASVATTGHLGIAPVYGSKCALSTVAFASLTHVMIIDFPRQRKGGGNLPASAKHPTLDLLEYIVLCSPYPKYAFRMDNIALSLILDLNLPIVNGVDLLDLQSNRQSFESVLVALGGKSYHSQLHCENIVALFQQEESSQTLEKHTTLQAWSACCAVMLDHMVTASDTPKISMLNFDQAHLMVLAKINRHVHRLTDLKPLRMHNEVEAVFSHKSGKLNVSSARFKNRVRKSGAQTMEISSSDLNGQPKTSPGHVLRVDGRAAMIAIQSYLSTQAPLKVTTIGREDPTQAEQARAMIVLAALQQSSVILDHPFIQALCITINFPGPLNNSQCCAVNLILSNRNADRVTVIQGPLGTGKTTVIAAAVTSIVTSTDRNWTLWLVAHSNIAVKNIAEKLASIEFSGFKILVLKDFHYDWHEHLYRLIEPNLIHSDDFIGDRVAMERLLLDSCIILCTLIQTIIFNEASQIEVSDYLPVIHRFASLLETINSIHLWKLIATELH